MEAIYDSSVHPDFLEKEALQGTEKIRQIDRHDTEITQKTSVALALSDQQRVIKTLVRNACRKEGAVPSITQITCLTEGVSNCWSVADSMKPLCCTRHSKG